MIVAAPKIVDLLYHFSANFR